MADLMGWFSGIDRKSLRELLEIEVKKGLNDIKLDTEELDVELEDIFDSLGDTFDSLGDTFDSLGGTGDSDSYGGSAGGYTGSSRREEERGKMRAALAADRKRMKENMQATKARLKEDRARMKADMKRMKQDLKKSRRGGPVNIQSGGGNNISVSGNESISISGSNGNLTMTVGNMSPSKFKNSITIRDDKRDIRTTVDYFDGENFTMTNDQYSGAFNVNDATMSKIKAHIRDDIRRRRHKGEDDTIGRLRAIRRLAGMDTESRPPPPEPQMPPNESFKEHELQSADVFTEYDKPHQSVPPHKCEPLFLTRTWKGDKGEPMEFDEGAKVTVSGHNAFGRKYEVKINGNAIYVPEIENLMDYCYVGDHLDTFLEMRSPAEKAILLKIIDGLIAMKIAEPHHEGIKELL